ncbi:hypothetical protein ACLOJK_039403 [Asimina triloba]
MAIEIVSTTALKPSPSSPSNAHIRLNIFDKALPDIHVAILHAFLPPMPSNADMKQGLAGTLAYFPQLAGRFSADHQGLPSILLNDAGIRFVEARVNMTLAERLPLEPSLELTQLHPPTDGVQELLQIQLNRFSCGGLVIGTTSHHRVADGQAMNSFFLAWARLVRGLDVDRLPYHDRAAISVPRNPPRSEFNHQAVEFREQLITTLLENPTPKSRFTAPIENLVVRFSADFVAKLKKHVMGGGLLGHRYSTFECVVVHLWKKITLVRGLQEDELTQLRVGVNGRPRMKPAVPMEFFGNMVLWAYTKLRVGNLVHCSHAFVANAIHEAVTQIDDAYFQSFIDFGEVLERAGGEGEVEMAATAPIVGNLCPDLEVDSWLRFQFHDLDFGGGGACDFLPPFLPVEGFVILVPSCTEKGGIDVYMGLTPDHVDHFKQICHSLD